VLVEPRKVRAVERVYLRYGRRLLRRAFARVWLGGAAWPTQPRPAIAFANHSAWWDPVVALFLSHDLFRRDPYGVMAGEQLRRFPFFRAIGCFGTTTESLADTRRLIEYAAGVLRDEEDGGVPPRVLWLFPQGALLPPRAPLAFASGLARLARLVPEAMLVPVAVRYEFRAEQRPECFVRVGEALCGVAAADGGSPRALTRRLEARLAAELRTLDEELARGESSPPAGYRVVLEGRGSLHTFYERTLGRLQRAASREQRAEED
jgi:chlorobactene lauroyltransferase